LQSRLSNFCVSVCTSACERVKHAAGQPLRAADRMCSRYIVVVNPSTWPSQRCVLAASRALSVLRVSHCGYIMPAMRGQKRTCRRLLSALTLSFSSLTLSFSSCSSRLEGPPNRSIILGRAAPELALALHDSHCLVGGATSAGHLGSIAIHGARAAMKTNPGGTWAAAAITV
jgi:hypothetical protein